MAPSLHTWDAPLRHSKLVATGGGVEWSSTFWVRLNFR